MAFSFGSAPAFGASAPAFGAASTPAFGAASTPGFGSTSLFGSPAPSGFGAATTPAPFTGFGQPASSSAFSFSSSMPSMFGTAAAGATAGAPAFGAASSPSPFGASAPSMFGTTGGFFGASTAAASPAGTLGLQQQQQQQQQLGLITYSTRYDDLPPDRQKELQDIQREISSYREDCEKLDGDPRLHSSLTLKKSLEEETAGLKQSLMGLLNSIRADDEALADFREKVLKLLRSTESAVRTYQRAKLWRDAPQQFKGQIIPSQVQELLASPVILPSPYLEQAIQGFQHTLENYRQVIAELEQALPSDMTTALGSVDEASLMQQLPLVISHMHDFFVHVAARMEKLHQQVQRSKDAFITQSRAEGNYSDPFAESKQHMALMSPRPGVHVSVSGHASPQQHYSTALVPSTPIAGMTPVQGTPAPTPFGTPFGGPISPAAGDMGRNTGRRRK